MATLRMDIEDEEVEREDFVPKAVGRGLLADFENPEDQQWYLADSEHPYAPFPGNALKWESFVYDDGTSFEGLARENIPHGKGVMVFGTGTGAGMTVVEPGDKYEGEFFAGFANGLGAYTGSKGEVYRGEWLYGKRHGCGAVTNVAPFFREIRKGATPEEAWKRTKNAISSKRMRYGQWERNKFVRDAGNDANEVCSVDDVRGILQELESVVTKSRMFQHKPDGDVVHLNLREQNGVPVPVFQDPLHYPHGTKFLAPGPLGQCHPIPEDANLRSEMRKHARNYMRIYNQYNLPFLARPGDDLFAATRLHRIQALTAEYLHRIENAEDEARIMKELDAKIRKIQAPAREKASETRLAREDRQRGREEPGPESSRTEDADIDDSDLVASAPGLPPSIFCSISSRRPQQRRFELRSFAKASSTVFQRVMRRHPINAARTND